MGKDVGTQYFSFTIDNPGDIDGWLSVRTLGAQDGRVILFDAQGRIVDYQDILKRQALYSSMTFGVSSDVTDGSNQSESHTSSISMTETRNTSGTVQ